MIKQDVLMELLKLALENKADLPTNRESECPFAVGEKYLIRTVTFFLTGQVKAITGKFLILKDAAWIADTGRFSQAITKGVLDEVEPVDEAIVNMDAIVDAFPWTHKLPTEVK